jgi:hypothetical protein
MYSKCGYTYVHLIATERSITLAKFIFRFTAPVSSIAAHWAVPRLFRDQ